MILGALMAHDGLLRQQTFDGGKRFGNRAGRYHICPVFTPDTLSSQLCTDYRTAAVPTVYSKRYRRASFKILVIGSSFATFEFF